MARKLAKFVKYSEEVTQKICDELANGKSLRQICAQEGMPVVGAVCKWLAIYPEFHIEYAKAREAQAEYYADEIVDIADNATLEEVQKAKLQIDSRKWVASKLKAKKYGDASLLKLADNEGEKLEGLEVAFIKTKNPDT